MLKDFKVSQSITKRSAELSMYLNDISKCKVLTDEEEVELVCAARSGDKMARERLIKGNLRFVVSVAKQYQGMGMELLDLINEGNLGLMCAVDKFDETRGFKFISFAVFDIRAAIISALNDKGHLVRLPRSQRGICETSQVSMDAPLRSDDGDNKTYLDTFSSDSRTDAGLAANDDKVVIRTLLAKLPPKSREMISYLFGIGCRVHSESEVSEIYRCTKERIRQRKVEILNELRLAAC